MEFDLTKLDLDNSHCEDNEEFISNVSESDACNALEFFDIQVKDNILSIPDEFDFDRALAVVEAYLSFHEDDVWDCDPDVKDEAINYDEATEASRGADDGTFDYCGTYVIDILTSLKANRE